MSEPIPEYSGCLWPVDPACLSIEWGLLDDSVRDRALALASSSLERLTGYRVGECPITIRPCVQRGCWAAFVPTSGEASPFLPGINTAGQWVNGCGCRDACATDCEIELPPPVGRIEQIKVDGDVLDPTDYRLDNGNVVTWVGAGECPWPQSQNMRLPDTEEGTFSITYLNRHPVDSLGAYAVGVLAMEFAKACAGDGKCALPKGVTQIVRQGVTMTISTGAFPGGMTGIRVVDSYIALWNPKGLMQDSTVWTPSQKRPRIVGSTP